MNWKHETIKIDTKTSILNVRVTDPRLGISSWASYSTHALGLVQVHSFRHNGMSMMRGWDVTQW